MAVNTMIHCSRSDHFMTCVKTGSNWYIHLNVNSHLMRVAVHTKAAFCFHLYNPQKPNKFYIKLFQVNEALSGYILGFEVYTGKQSVSMADQAMPLDVTCTRTTKLVLGL